MADIELVIKISEEKYKWIKENILRTNKNSIVRAIIDGTPLPKGHGDLIDRNSILCDDLSCDLCGYTDECFKLLAPTILKADKESEEV